MYVFGVDYFKVKKCVFYKFLYINQSIYFTLCLSISVYIYLFHHHHHHHHLSLYIYIYIVKLTEVEGNSKAPFSIATTPRCRGRRYSFPGIDPLILDPYLIMLSVKQGGNKYHILSLWYDSTGYLTPVSRAIGEHSTHFDIVARVLQGNT